MSNTLIQYKRNKKGQARGIVVATENGVGFALCRKSDTFNKQFGQAIALQRVGSVVAAESIRQAPEKIVGENGRVYMIPHSLRDLVSRAEERRARYFQEK